VTGARHERHPLEDLHGGWPFGPGPDEWPVRLQELGATDIQPEGMHLLCDRCGQSVSRLGRWSFTLAGLKPQIAAHVMQVHSGELPG
jgi:hypothetical protein